MGVVSLALVALVVGCGRIGIEPIEHGDATPKVDAAADGAIDATAATLAGTYTLDSTIAYTCASGLVDVAVTKFTFAPAGMMISATSDDPGAPQQPCAMLGPTPAGAVFDVTCTLPGVCNETYRLTGSIVDSKHWTGTFTATFSGTCLDCTLQTSARMGTAP